MGTRICTTEGCGRKHYARGKCKRCYRKLQAGLEKREEHTKIRKCKSENEHRLDVKAKRNGYTIKGTRICDTEGCNGTHAGLGKCMDCYNHLPEVVARRREYQARRLAGMKASPVKYEAYKKERNAYNRNYNRANRERIDAQVKERNAKKLYAKMDEMGISPETQKAMMLDGEVLETRMKQLKVEKW